MEAVYKPSSLSATDEPSTCDELSMLETMILSDSLKDLKSLRTQLYSAAEYFEVSYTNDDQKQIVVNTLKDYAIQALVNTVDHLGSVTYKVNGLVDEKVNEVSVTELSVSCIEQRLRTCQDYIDHEGLSQQSLVITTPKYQKRYTIQGKCTNGSEGALVHCEDKSQVDDNWQVLRRAVRSAITERPPPSVKKPCSPLPSPRPAPLLLREKRSVSPVPSSQTLVRSGSVASKPTSPSLSRHERQYPSVPRRSASMHLQPEKEEKKEDEPNPSKGKKLFKALLGRRKWKEDPMLYTYLDEY